MRTGGRKLVLRISASLGLGLATTVGIAWGIAMFQGVHPWYDQQNKAYSREGNTYAFIGVRKQPGRTWTNVYVQHVAERSRGRVDATGMFEDIASLTLPAWSKARDIQARGLPAFADLAPGTLIIDEAFGWPLAALRSSVRATTEKGDVQPMVRSIRWGILFKQEKKSWFDLPSVLPFMPVWGAFTLDLSLFSASWFIVLWLYDVNRRLRGGRAPSAI